VRGHLPLTSQLEHHLAQEDVSKQELLPQNTFFLDYTKNDVGLKKA